MRFIIFFALFLYLLRTNAQSTYNYGSFPSGIYKNLKEFKEKQPSFELTGKLIRDTIVLKRSFATNTSVGSVSFIIEDKTLRKQENKRIGFDIFGVSDGEDFYLSGCLGDNNCHFTKTAYYRLRLLNKTYGVCRRIYVNPFFEGDGRSIFRYIVNLNNGKQYLLTKSFVKEKLRSYPDLFKKFKKEKKRNNEKLLLKYFELFLAESEK